MISHITIDPVNDPPYISKIDHQYINEENRSTPIHLTISDIEPGQLELNAQTNNAFALPTSCLNFPGNSGASYVANVSSGEPKNLTLLIFPPKDVNGTVSILLTVYDRSGLSYSTQFPLTILPVNDMPQFDVKDITLDVNEDVGSCSCK